MNWDRRRGRAGWRGSGASCRRRSGILCCPVCGFVSGGVSGAVDLVDIRWGRTSGGGVEMNEDEAFKTHFHVVEARTFDVGFFTGSSPGWKEGNGKGCLY